MEKKKVVILCVVLLVFGLLAGAGTTYTISKLTNMKESYSDNVQDKIDEIKNELTGEDDEADVEDEDAAEAEEAVADAEDIAAPDENLPIQTPEDALTTASEKTMDVAEIVQKCLPSVVAITNKGETEIRSMWGNFKQESQSSGSGVIIGQTDTELLILTNYHVVEDSEQLSVVFSWEEDQENVDERNIITAQIKDYDSARDIAVIAIAMDSLEQVTVEHITVASIGNSDDLMLGQQVVAIGNALGYGQSVTTGIVSAMNRTVEAGSQIGSANKYIQTDAAINPGNSGGALFNMNGELIGINSAKIATSTVEGMGYAIPISTIMENVENMMNSETKTALPEEERGVLGISVIDVTSDINQSYGMPIGVYISDTAKGAGADKAGLKKGDIITAVNGKTVSDTAALKNYLSYYAAGETVTVTIQRQSDDGYAAKDVEVVLSEASVNTPETADTEEPAEEDAEEENDPDANGIPYDIYDFLNPFGDLFGW